MTGEIEVGNALPEFREYAHIKYPELDEDLITMMEDLIEYEKEKSTHTDSKSGN